MTGLQERVIARLVAAQNVWLAPGATDPGGRRRRWIVPRARAEPDRRPGGPVMTDASPLTAIATHPREGPSLSSPRVPAAHRPGPVTGLRATPPLQVLTSFQFSHQEERPLLPREESTPRWRDKFRVGGPCTQCPRLGGTAGGEDRFQRGPPMGDVVAVAAGQRHRERDPLAGRRKVRFSSACAPTTHRLADIPGGCRALAGGGASSTSAWRGPVPCRASASSGRSHPVASPGWVARAPAGGGLGLGGC